MQTIFPKATAHAAPVATALAVSGILWVLSLGQALAAFCPAASCSVVLMNSNSVGNGMFGDMNFAVSLNVATIDLNLASGNRISKIDFPSAPGLADNLGGKLTMANLKIFNPQELSSALLIDATRKHPYPPTSLPAREYMEHAVDIWRELDLPELSLDGPWHG